MGTLASGSSSLLASTENGDNSEATFLFIYISFFTNSPVKVATSYRFSSDLPSIPICTPKGTTSVTKFVLPVTYRYDPPKHILIVESFFQKL